ncbi:MAG: class I SAM-dependent methyltransferase [Nitrospiraceae bacterium]|nr:class I SAM-dependent methyltransferase [Nitrospiraceae bacterium]
MKLNLFERLMTNSRMRYFVQTRIEGPKLKSMASRERYPVCLELGTGAGGGARIIIGLFGAEKVVATDIDPAQIERAKKRLGPLYGGRVVLKVEDALDLSGEPAGGYDAVFAFSVIHHTEDWRRALREISRVLKPGGEYFFDELLKDFLASPLIKAATDHPRTGMFTAGEFTGYLAQIGLKPIRQWRWDGIWLLGSAMKEKG